MRLTLFEMRCDARRLRCAAGLPLLCACCSVAEYRVLTLPLLPSHPLPSSSPFRWRHQNFDQVVNGNQYVLVYFYTPQCNMYVCQSLASEFAAAASQLASLGITVVMAMVDADSTAGGQALAARFNVTGFPALFWFENGKSQSYSGISLYAADINFWVIDRIDTVTTTLTMEVRLFVSILPSSFFTRHPFGICALIDL